MQHNASRVSLLALLAVLAAVLYPTLAFNRFVAPEASLRQVAPWRLQWGPGPEPSPIALAAATTLGPRLHGIARDGWRIALWNPWVGGGRGGWLASPAEGRAPLVLLSGLLARDGTQWTALLALEISCAFLGTIWLLGRLGVRPLAAVSGAVVYAFSGAMASAWLDWRGSAVALGPALLALLLGREARPARRVLLWALVLAVVFLSGPPAVPFLALALLFEFMPPGRQARATGAWTALAALPVAVAMVLPALWLGTAAAEPGSPTGAASIEDPLPGLEALVVPFPGGDPREMSASPPGLPDPSLAGEGFIGAGSAALVLVGVVLGRHRRRWIWLGALLASLCLAFAPPGMLGAFGLTGRPVALLALGVAVLAATGVDALGARTPEAWRTAVGVGFAVALALELGPSALHRLPLATRQEAAVAPPLAPAAFADGSRAVALLGTMPPDIGESLAVPDVRARSLRAEPRYAQRIGWREGTTVSAEQALSDAFALVGARWILEPMPLRVVTGEIYSRIELGEATRTRGLRPGAERFLVELPAGMTRLGLGAAGGEPKSVVLSRGDVATKLVPDHALAAESSEWSWYAVPIGWPAGEAELVVESAGAPLPARLALARDRSGLRLHAERRGVRVWESERAEPFARLVEPRTGHEAASLGRAQVVDFRAQRLRLRAACAAPATLAVQVKYRPTLWRAEVDGRRAEIRRFDDVWSAVSLGPGRHDVVLSARVPAGVWLISSAGLLSLACLAVIARPR